MSKIKPDGCIISIQLKEPDMPGKKQSLFIKIIKTIWKWMLFPFETLFNIIEQLWHYFAEFFYMKYEVNGKVYASPSSRKFWATFFCSIAGAGFILKFAGSPNITTPDLGILSTLALSAAGLYTYAKKAEHDIRSRGEGHLRMAEAAPSNIEEVSATQSDTDPAAAPVVLSTEKLNSVLDKAGSIVDTVKKKAGVAEED